MSGEMHDLLAEAWVEPVVWVARPDYVAVLVHACRLRVLDILLHGVVRLGMLFTNTVRCLR